MRLNNVIAVMAVLASTQAYAHADAAPVEKKRRFSVGPSAMRLLQSDALEGYGANGYGLQSLYEFVLSDRFALGIDLTYRRLSGGDRSGSQLRYGLVLKHDFAGEYFAPYVAYGLLMQVIKLEHVKGDGTAHDTKLAVGTRLNTTWYVEAAYHISRLRYFGTDAIRLDYVEANGGYIYAW